MDEISEALKETETADKALRDNAAQLQNESEPSLLGERHRLRAIEAELSGYIKEISRQLASADSTQAGDAEEFGSADLFQRAEELEARTNELQRQAQALAQLHADLTDRHDLWHQRVEQERAELDRERVRTHRQRRRIAADLKERREEILRQAALLEVQRDAGQPCAAENADSSCGLRQSAEPLAGEVGEMLTRLGAEVEALRSQRDALLERVSAAEAARTTAAAADDATSHEAVPNAADADKIYELQRRFELAVEDMRSYKHRVTELEELLAAQQSEVAAKPAGDALDWETQKQQMLASMDAEFKQDDPQSNNDRLTVEGAIRITDDVVAARDREIADLKRQLEQPRAAAPGPAIRDAAVADVLDRDAVVVEERERLRKMQQEVREKQRQIEVEVAIERARFARERLELEEQIHTIQTELSKRSENPRGSSSTTPTRAPAKQSRGRWLARLGLKDADEES